MHPGDGDLSAGPQEAGTISSESTLSCRMGLGRLAGTVDKIRQQQDPCENDP